MCVCVCMRVYVCVCVYVCMCLCLPLGQAPVELVTNCVIVGFVLIVTDSEFHVFQEYTFASMNQCIINTMTVHEYQQYRGWARWQKYGLAALCGVITLLVNQRPIQMICSYLMGFVAIRQFTRVHEVSSVCNNIDGLSGFDTMLGLSATALAWALTCPMLYVFGNVFTPSLSPSNAEAVGHFKSQLRRHRDKDAGKDVAAADAAPGHSDTCIREAGHATTSKEYDLEIEHGDIYVTNTPILGNNEKIQMLPSLTPDTGDGEQDVRGIGGWLGSWLLAVLKLSSLISPDLIVMRMQKRWVVQMRNIVFAPSQGFTSDSVKAHSSSSAKATKSSGVEEAPSWEEEQTRRLPSYYAFCLLVFREMEVTYGPSTIGTLPVYAVVALVPPLHLLTQVGRLCWGIVASKYVIFIMATLGIWLPGFADYFDINELMRMSQVPNEHAPGLVAILATRHRDGSSECYGNGATEATQTSSSLSNPGRGLFNSCLKDAKIDVLANGLDRADMTRLLAFVILPRLVLLQALPYMTFVSVFGMYTAMVSVGYIYRLKCGERAHDELLMCSTSPCLYCLEPNVCGVSRPCKGDLATVRSRRYLDGH
jgi:hypothetical protein